ncbi:DnaT-like ssDNA-binding protein [Neisseria bacilliformis]|uniref:DnaT-like ssDNA-binding protein n=1 Tax=Neisseria bacilliformis TaxID=267212 RepID=UPI0028E9424C|nr:DnaT-like ssDNA-binding protein [Neisseria bacilliformis]
MIREFVSAAEAAAVLPAGADAERAAMLANLWLSRRGLRAFSAVPDEVRAAALELAKMAHAGRLYADTQTGLLAETVKADSVSVSRSFAASAKASAGEMRVIEDLIAPYLDGSRLSNAVRLARW